ncbi:MAG TPA: ABC transporter permease [Bryobacteraceae bacterium]|nr:ABC transporter permease [Bryobacteraceae bacterium]
MEDLLRDLKRSARALRESPAFTLAALAALALGIGANTAVFSVVNTVLLKPIAAPQADRIVQFVMNYGTIASPGGSAHHFYFWGQQQSLFRDVSALRLELLNFAGLGEPQQIPAARVSAGFFRLFGASPVEGRVFDSDEDRPGGPHVAVLSYGLWAGRFGRDPAILGRTVPLSGELYTVVGVMARGFDSEQFDEPPQVWIPYQMDPNSTDGDCYCRVVGRLQPGMTLDVANARLKALAQQFRRAFPGQMVSRMSFSVQSLRNAMVGDVRPLLMILAVAVTFVLLIACTNVAGLLLVRGNAQRREIAVRSALGASRGRLIRQLLTESLMLSLAGGAFGLVIGLAGIRAILGLYPGNPLLAPLNMIHIPRIGENGSAVSLDWRVLAFTLSISLFTGVLFGLIPAFQASRVDLVRDLKESSGRTGSGLRQNKTRSLLVAGEIALALILLIGAALLIRSSMDLQNVDPGFDSHNVLIMQMSLAGTRFERTVDIDRLVRGGVRSIRALPGVTAAAVSCCVPLETVWQNFFIVQGRPLAGRFHGIAGWTFVSPEYFQAFHIPILRGREFTERDNASAPGVVVINETMARIVWPHGDPLMDRLLLGRGMRPEYDKDPIRQIVGIVGDVRAIGLNREPRPEMYVPIAQLPDGINALNLRLLPIAWIVRTSVEPHSLSSAIEGQLRKGTGQPVARVRSMAEVMEQSTARTQLNMLLMTIFGCSALLLAAIGIYGLIAYSVQQRTQEIGIRLALGAEESSVRKMVIVQGMRLALIGAAIGLIASFELTRFLASFLFGVKPWDPVVFASVPITLCAVALLAVWLPARRATRIDPIVALRYE